MKNKPWDVCQKFLCRRETWSGKPEPDKRLRWCQFHISWGIAGAGSAHHRQPPKVSPTASVKGKASPFAIPLICAFHTFHVTPDDRVLRMPYICGKPAPRRLRGDRNLPRFPNRYGDPLCEEHRRYADDERAFPDEEGATLSSARDERAEEQQAKSKMLHAMLHQAIDDVRALEAQARSRPKA